MVTLKTNLNHSKPQDTEFEGYTYYELMKDDRWGWNAGDILFTGNDPRPEELHIYNLRRQSWQSSAIKFSDVRKLEKGESFTVTI